jgi:hypothetical protein
MRATSRSEALCCTPWSAVRLLAVISLLGIAVLACTDSPGIQSVPQPAKAVVVHSASPGDDSTWDTFAADVSVRLERVDSAGKSVDASDPGLGFSLERTLQSNGVWKSVITVRSSSELVAPRPKGATFESDRFDIGRIEDDGLGALPRVYNRRGDLLSAPSESDLQSLFPGTSLPAEIGNRIKESQGASAPSPKRNERRWVERFVTAKERVAERRAAIENAFGSATGKLGGRDRYVRQDGDNLVEILVDGAKVLPVEVNEAFNGMLRAHTSFSYADSGDGLVTLQSIRSERAESNATKGRSILTITYANVRLERRG